jgi:cytochrome c biogenesis factor
LDALSKSYSDCSGFGGFGALGAFGAFGFAAAFFAGAFLGAGFEVLALLGAAFAPFFAGAGAFWAAGEGAFTLPMDLMTSESFVSFSASAKS